MNRGWTANFASAFTRIWQPFTATSAQAHRVGGVADHVHIITTLPRTLSQAQRVEQVKKTSSKWIKSLGHEYRGFFWQRGRVSGQPQATRCVLAYVDKQEEHHRV